MKHKHHIQCFGHDVTWPRAEGAWKRAFTHKASVWSVCRCAAAGSSPACHCILERRPHEREGDKVSGPPTRSLPQRAAVIINSGTQWQLGRQMSTATLDFNQPARCRHSRGTGRCKKQRLHDKIPQKCGENSYYSLQNLMQNMFLLDSAACFDVETI